MAVINKLTANKTFSNFGGCIATGKEANVYDAYDATNKHYAVKIFKTSILIFKDRERYVCGEFRFRRCRCKGNPRRMVKMWAEKEFRNLKRINGTSIKVPVPYQCKGNVLVMELIGENGEYNFYIELLLD